MLSRIRSQSSRERRSIARGSAIVVALSMLAATTRGDEAERSARALYSRGQRAYDVGDYQEALEIFETAYSTKPLPGFLFNLGQCHRQLGSLERALELYRAYLDQGGKQRQLVEELMVEVQAQIEADRASSPATGDAVTAPEHPASDPTTGAPAEVTVASPPNTTPGESHSSVDIRAAPTAPVTEPPPEEGGWIWWTAGAIGGVVVVAAIVVGGLYYLATLGADSGESNPSLGRADLREP